MIVCPKEAYIKPYNDEEYKRLTNKFCSICESDLLYYIAFLEFCLKAYHDKNITLDDDLIGVLKKQLIENCLNYDEVTIFLNSVFLELITPFHYSKVKDLIHFLESFPYKSCDDCNL